MKDSINLLDTVALTVDVPARGLVRGEVGTVVEVLAPNVFEVEFSGDDGRTYAEFSIGRDDLIHLHNRGKALRLAA